MRLLDGQDVLHLLDDADGALVPLRIGANVAERAVADAVAPLAVADLLAKVYDRLPQMLRIGGRLTKQVQRHTHSSLAPYARKEGELIYGTLEPLGGVLIFHSLVGRHKDTKMATALSLEKAIL